MVQFGNSGGVWQVYFGTLAHRGVWGNNAGVPKTFDNLGDVVMNWFCSLGDVVMVWFYLGRWYGLYDLGD